MAKDPAFLFYYDRFMLGTYSMTNEEVGAYMRLLCLQANKGYVTMEEINNTRLTSDIQVKNKFEEISPGVFRNAVLFDIMEDRKKFTESRRSNRLGKKKGVNEKELVNNTSYSSDELVVNVNVNKDNSIKKEGVKGEEVFTVTGLKPGVDDLGMDIPEIKIGSVIQFFSAAQSITLSNIQVKQMWEAFKAQHFTSEKYYKSLDDIYSHFINWSRQQKIKDGNSKNAGTAPKGGRNQGTYDFANKVAAEFAAANGGNGPGKV